MRKRICVCMCVWGGVETGVYVGVYVYTCVRLTQTTVLGPRTYVSHQFSQPQPTTQPTKPHNRPPREPAGLPQPRHHALRPLREVRPPLPAGLRGGRPHPGLRAPLTMVVMAGLGWTWGWLDVGGVWGWTWGGWMLGLGCVYRRLDLMFVCGGGEGGGAILLICGIEQS